MKKGNIISFIRSFNVSLTNLGRNLGSTHYSTAGSTDYDHMKNSLNQAHSTENSRASPTKNSSNGALTSQDKSD